jgi:hypothetical protein
LAHSTPQLGARRPHARRLLAAITAVLALSAILLPAVAWADGDPASDVLADQTVFIPAGRGIPAVEQARLQEVVRTAARNGVPVRVALIAARSDLGAVTQLWRQPAQYARFLGTELSDVFSGTLIVVMPNGYGVWIVGHAASGAALQRAGASLIGAPLAGSGPETAAAAVVAVRRVAAADGHPLPAPTVAAAAVRSSGGIGPVAWAVLAAGALMIAAAWTASLRAVPPRGRGESAAARAR